MSRLDLFYKNLQQDLKLFIFIWLVLGIFRLSFIAIMYAEVRDFISLEDVVVSLYYGGRISLKSAGLLAISTFLFCTATSLVSTDSKHLRKLRFILGSAYVFIITLLFHVRIPYYREFASGFNQFVFNIFKDDICALFNSTIQYYHISVYIISIIFVWFVLSQLLKLWLQVKTFDFPKFSRTYYTSLFVITMLVTAIFSVRFIRFGGSLLPANAINWENAAKTNNLLLNEAILDDLQALYRAYQTYEILHQAKGLNLSSERIDQFGILLSRKVIQEKYLEDYLAKFSRGARIAKPKHVFLIIAESYSQWPLMAKYEKIRISSGLKSIITKDNAVLIPSFLPSGNGTIGAVNCLITGLAEVNVYPNYQSETFKTQYATALAVQMKQLGYKTNFWYGGYGSWQNIEKFALAQGFERFYSSADILNKSGNAWGIEDKYFLRFIMSNINDNSPSFNMILTSSNHHPYTINLDQEGFYDSIAFKDLPVTIKRDEEKVVKLGHFWYGDKILTNFIESVRTNYPDSLFIITGDHADRMGIISNPTLFERYSVPLVIYGNGVNKSILPSNACGAHINIIPTLVELIAPKGFKYYSLGKSLTQENTVGIHQGAWICGNYIGKYNYDACECLQFIINDKLQPDLGQVKSITDAVRGLSWWRIINGNKIH